MDMKRLILLLICALYVTTAAQAQISFYGEWCRKGGGEKTIMIFDMKEKKAYVMNEARKTCMVMEEIDKLSTNKLVGYDWEVSHSTSREFLGMEEIDGVPTTMSRANRSTRMAARMAPAITNGFTRP